jgi:hypothetical protein
MLSLTCGVSSILIRHCLLDCNQDWSNRLFCHEIPIYRLATTSVHPHYCFSSHFHFSFKAFLSIIILGLLWWPCKVHESWTTAIFCCKGLQLQVFVVLPNCFKEENHVACKHASHKFIFNIILTFIFLISSTFLLVWFYLLNIMKCSSPWEKKCMLSFCGR